MIKYNYVIIENEVISSYLNFKDENEFLENLWDCVMKMIYGITLMKLLKF